MMCGNCLGSGAVKSLGLPRGLRQCPEQSVRESVMQSCSYESRHRHSIFCILPPHILREMARHGSAAQRNAALNTLALDATHRTQRVAMQLLAAAPRQVVTAAAPQVHRTIY